MLDANFWQDKINSKKILKEKKLFEDLDKFFENSFKN
jgi:peptide chain release factor 2